MVRPDKFALVERWSEEHDAGTDRRAAICATRISSICEGFKARRAAEDRELFAARRGRRSCTRRGRQWRHTTSRSRRTIRSSRRTSSSCCSRIGVAHDVGGSRRGEGDAGMKITRLDRSGRGRARVLDRRRQAGCDDCNAGNGDGGIGIAARACGGAERDGVARAAAADHRLNGESAAVPQLELRRPDRRSRKG